MDLALIQGVHRWFVLIHCRSVASSFGRLKPKRLPLSLP